MKRFLLILGLILIGANLSSPGAGLIIISGEVPGATETRVIPPPWDPNPPPPHWPVPPPRWIPRPIHRYTPLEIRSLKASVAIENQIARTTIEQEFYNPNPNQLEGTFMLPLPKGAHLTKFQLEVNGKMTDAELLSADKAKDIYEEIVRQVKDPALLEYVGQELLKVRIFPIEPHKSKRIELSYSQLLKSDTGLVEYTLPLNIAKHSSGPIKNFAMKIDLESKTPLKTLYSPSHSVEIVRHTSRSAALGLEETEIRPDKDFQFFYSAEKQELGLDFLTYKKSGEDGYFMLLASPGIDHGENKIVPKDVVFVLDSSGSMSGDKLEQAKNALLYCVNSLNPQDRFEIVRFSTEAETLFRSLEKVSKESRGRATEFVQAVKATGGTAIHDALLKALDLCPETSERPYVVVFLTDGQPTVGITKEDEILAAVKNRNASNTRVFTFGLGTDVNTHLLDKIAEETSALSQYVLPEEDIEIKVSSFFSKINDPVLAGVEIDFGDIRTAKLHPEKMPDLFKGQQVIDFGRYKHGGKTTATLTGQIGDEKKSFSYEVEFPEEASEHEFIPRLWATRRVGHLLDEIRLNGKSKELEEEVTELAKAYGIVTPYTSYLVQEDLPVQLSRSAPRQIHLSRSPGRRSFQTAQPAEQLMEPLPSAVPAPTSGETAVLRSRYESELKLATSDQAISHVRESLARVNASSRASAGSAAPEPAPDPRYAGGKTFYYEDGVWIDYEALKVKNLDSITVPFNSKEYYQLAARPEVREWLALGTQLKFVLNGKLYEITPEAAGTSSPNR